MRRAASVGAAGLVLLFPVAAQARTKTVQIGVPAHQQGKFNKLSADVNDFFPHGVTIHVGDKIRFAPTGEFHTVDIPRKGRGPLPAPVPTKQLVAGLNDAAGHPFWFNGQPNFTFNPLLAPAAFGKKLTYRGTRRIESGFTVNLQNPNKLPKPFTVKFTKAGSYTYFCDLHPGMKGVVRVVRKARRIPSARADRRALKKQVSRDLSRAKKLGATQPPTGIVDVGGHARGGVEYYGMLPGNVTVKVGTTLVFQMAPNSTEDHTATFGPGNPLTDPKSYLGAIAATFQGFGPFDPRAVYPSEQPPATGTLTEKLHGNGFWNSGVLDRDTSSPLPPLNKLTFGQVGKYDYYCMIHPFMHGTITVTE
jgi:plastocyanin